MSRRRGAAALAVAVGLSLLPACQGTLPGVEGLTRIGQSALPVGPERERQIGFGIAATVAGRYPLVDDPDLNRYLNLVGGTVAQQSPRRAEVDFRFGVLDTGEVNAFAAPGGWIFVTRGALDRMSSEAELAGVLAHEVAHVDEEHVLDEIRRSSVFQSVQEEAQLSGELLDRIAEVGTTALFTGLSREDELEADSLGVLYAAASGYRADGLVAFLDRLAGEEAAAGEDTREWRVTHPPTSERAAAARRILAASALGGRGGVELAERFRERTGRR